MHTVWNLLSVHDLISKSGLACHRNMLASYRAWLRFLKSLPLRPKENWHDLNAQVLVYVYAIVTLEREQECLSRVQHEKSITFYPSRWNFSFTGMPNQLRKLHLCVWPHVNFAWQSTLKPS